MVIRPSTTPAAAAPHHGGDAEGDDHLLAEVEGRERGLAPRRRILPALQLFVRNAGFRRLRC